MKERFSEINNLNGKKILFLAPHFFGYEKAIANRLRELGAEVDFFNERPSDSVWAKGMVRVKSRFYQNTVQKYYGKILRQITGKKYDYFLLIKGEAVPHSFLEKFRAISPLTVRIFCSYDPVFEYPEVPKLYPYFNKNFTFEPSDARKYGLHFRPNFFLNEYKRSETKEKPKYDIAFIGSAHTDRYLVGEKISNLARKLSLETFFYYYAPGKTAFVLKKIFDKNLQQFNMRKLSFTKLTHHQIAEIYSHSFSVLEINKPFQLGLTMRPFETLASGKKLITTNADIKNYPFYNAENILILDRKNIQLDEEFFKSGFKTIDSETLEMMTLDSWIHCVFFKDQDDYWGLNSWNFEAI
ncbi:MAG: hypothetical protein K0M56_06795 [Kaistella sp.]|nr:hypothetical protein [Kaistella sp.]